MGSNQARQGLLSPFLQARRVKAARPFLAGNVLDIGCGNGALAELVPSNRYLGMDRDPVVIAVARARFPQHRFVETLPESQSDFDTLVSLAVIEHITNPGAALADWARLVKSGGRMVLTTPNPSLEWAHELGAKFGVFSHDAAEEHEEMLDEAKFRALLAGTNLALETYRPFLFGANQLFVVRKG